MAIEDLIAQKMSRAAAERARITDLSNAQAPLRESLGFLASMDMERQRMALSEKQETRLEEQQEIENAPLPEALRRGIAEQIVPQVPAPPVAQDVSLDAINAFKDWEAQDGGAYEKRRGQVDTLTDALGLHAAAKIEASMTMYVIQDKVARQEGMAKLAASRSLLSYLRAFRGEEAQPGDSPVELDRGMTAKRQQDEQAERRKREAADAAEKEATATAEEGARKSILGAPSLADLDRLEGEGNLPMENPRIRALAAHRRKTLVGAEAKADRDRDFAALEAQRVATLKNADDMEAAGRGKEARITLQTRIMNLSRAISKYETLMREKVITTGSLGTIVESWRIAPLSQDDKTKYDALTKERASLEAKLGGGENRVRVLARKIADGTATDADKAEFDSLTR